MLGVFSQQFDKARALNEYDYKGQLILVSTQAVKRCTAATEHLQPFY